jgi:RIO kinase 2
MSSIEVALQVFQRLTREDLRVLRAVEDGMRRSEFVPEDYIVNRAKLPMGRVKFALSRLNKFNLIYQMQSAYVGHTLNYAGYDCLAIVAFVKANVVEAFGKPVGVGKEADVYEALTPTHQRIAVKFHRLGRTSFRQTRRKRGYTETHAGWLYQSRLAAWKEFTALKEVYKCRLPVPEPIMQNRHAIAMGMIEGVPLAQLREIPNPEATLRRILRSMKKAYVKAKRVHGDLSAYNILLKPNGQILIIDWPQSVSMEHPNAEQLLRRDVRNILEYFEHKHHVQFDSTLAYDYVTDKTRQFTG